MGKKDDNLFGDILRDAKSILRHRKAIKLLGRKIDRLMRLPIRCPYVFDRSGAWIRLSLWRGCWSRKRRNRKAKTRLLPGWKLLECTFFLALSAFLFFEFN